MDRVKDYISFAVWFVGLSYVALWPMAVPDSIAAWLAPQVRGPLACGGLVIVSLQELCRAHEAVALSPGLHWIGTLAAFWVTARLFALLSVRLAQWLLPRAVQRLLAPARLKAALWQPLLRQTVMRLIWRRVHRLPPPRYVPRRSHFGLRDGPR